MDLRIVELWYEHLESDPESLLKWGLIARNGPVRAISPHLKSRSRGIMVLSLVSPNVGAF